MALNGRDFANRTLYSQAYRPRHQSLLSGQVYYVTVQASSRNAARLTANATSAGVKACRSATLRLVCYMSTRPLISVPCEACHFLACDCTMASSVMHGLSLNAAYYRVTAEFVTLPCAACCRTAWVSGHADAGGGQPTAHAHYGPRVQHARLPHCHLANLHIQHLVRKSLPVLEAVPESPEPWACGLQ